jgi:hypothetical protein
MFNNNKQSIYSGDGTTNVNIGRDFILYIEGKVPTELINEKIEEEIQILRKSRFFLEFDTARITMRLAENLTIGQLSGGSTEVRGPALAWCARLLSRSKYYERAVELLDLAKTLGDFTEAKIAEAFILSQKGHQTEAFQALANIDSDVSHSTRLMIFAKHHGAEDALNWMKTVGYTVQDLDSDGKSVLLGNQLQLGRWGETAQTVRALSETDFEETPILYHWAALATLVATIPPDFRTSLLTHVPFEARDFPLASDAIAMEARRIAHKNFLDAFEVAKRLSLLRSASLDDEYALWLELRDPDQNAHGMKRLENKLRDTSVALGYVHYALQFGIKLDLGKVEQDIERSVAINGGMTIDAASARFALAFMQSTPVGVANYISHHYSQLVAHIDAKLMRYRQIEMLSRAGLIDRAQEVFDQLLEEDLPAEHARHLQRIISEAQGRDSGDSLKAQYETTKALTDLINLVAELEVHQCWEDLCEYGRRLFDETHDLRDACRLVSAFNSTHKSEMLVNFLREHCDLLSQSKHLLMSYAWGLYHEGAFIESSAVLLELTDEMASPNYRALQVNLGIATGDWDALSTYIADEYRNRVDRSSSDLIGAAQLALQLGLPQAKDLVFEAAAKADGDSAVLATAYFIATSAGWDDDQQVFQWLEMAEKLSGDDGPLQRMSLRDILDQKPEWDRRESETWRMLGQGKIPIYFAAQSLNKTLIDLTTFPALANLDETDPRRRSAIPAFRGKLVSVPFDVGGKNAALDATALLTLSFLKILDVALDAFKTVYIPHSTLGWLFGERQKAAFHQPSRIKSAHKVRNLLATNFLEKFISTTTASSDLSAQVGDELAAFIAEAEKERDGAETQHIVVRSAPVHRLSSLMEEEADLSTHASVLSSCLAVVVKLKQKGQITSSEERRAYAYLQLNEIPWPNQPDIADGAILYLDDIAVAYFLHLGFLGKLKDAGLRAIVSPSKVSETDALISYERISEEVKLVIENIRASLNLRISSGKVIASRSRNFEKLEEKSILGHPSVDILALAAHCDVTIIDDRFMNQHVNIDNGSGQVPILTTIELLDALVESGILSDDDRLEYRTCLRRSSYFFIPLTLNELEKCLRESTIVDGVLAETAELKAIRESVLRVRMCDWLQLPEEMPWLIGILNAFTHAIRNLWVDGADIEEVSVRSNWLVEQIDVRGWAHCLVPERADSFVRIERGAYILLLLAPLSGVQQSVVDDYWEWVEERILIPIQEQFPEMYEWLVNWYRGYIAKTVETNLSGGDVS